MYHGQLIISTNNFQAVTSATAEDVDASTAEEAVVDAAVDKVSITV